MSTTTIPGFAAVDAAVSLMLGLCPTCHSEGKSCATCGGSSGDRYPPATYVMDRWEQQHDARIKEKDDAR